MQPFLKAAWPFVYMYMMNGAPGVSHVTNVPTYLSGGKNEFPVTNIQGSHKLWESWKTWKIMKKSWNLKKKLNNHGISMTKPPVARNLAVGHLCVRQLFFWLLVVSSFNYFKIQAWSTSMLLLLHSAFMISVVNLLLKGEVGVCALNSHGN